MRREASNRPKRRKAKPKQLIESENGFHYGFYCVAFLDILGQRRKLRQLPRLPTKNEETRNLLAETAGYVHLVRKDLKTIFEQFAKPSPVFDQLPEDAKRRLVAGRNIVKYGGFSDSIFMAVPFLGDREQFAPIRGVFGCIAACCILHLLALSRKRPIRGGIDVGPGLDLTKDEVYGPALERAHFLESKVADYPRVVVGDGLLEYLDSLENQSDTATPFGRITRGLAVRCKQFITVDTDGLHMIDFLGEEAAKLALSDDNRQKLFRPANDYVEEQKQIARTENDQEHLSRYDRLGAYFDKHAKFWS